MKATLEITPTNDALSARLEQFRQLGENYVEKFCEPETTIDQPEPVPQPTALQNAMIKARAPKKQRNRTEFSGEAWLKTLALLQSRLGKGGIFALIGSNGPGKTQMAVECMRDILQRPRGSALYAVAMDVFLDLRATFRRDSEKDERAVIADYARPALLVIDECQERGDTDFEDRMLTYLIDRRYRDEKDTILISNLRRQEFETSLGRSVIDRLNETGGIIECTWPSFRR